MKHSSCGRRFWSFFLTLCLLITLFAPAPASAETFPAEVNVTKMTIRSGATSAYPVSGYLEKGDQVTVLSYSDGIARIQYNGKTGYARVSDMKHVSSSSASGTATVTASSVKVYPEPNTAGSSYFTLKKGATFTIVSKCGSWAKLQNGMSYGYVKLSGISVSSVTATPSATEWDAPEEPAATPKATPVPSPTPTGLAVIKKDDTKIYSSASTAAKVLMKLKKNSTFTILSLNDKWAKLENGKYYGYVPATDINVLPGVTATPTPAVNPVVTPTPKPTAAPTADAPSDVIGIGTVNCAVLYVYNSASTSAKVTHSLAKGDTVTVLASNGYYAKIRKGSYEGFVKLVGLNVVSTGATPTPTPANSNPTIPESKNIAAFTSCSMTLYSKASTGSGKLKTLAMGTELTVLGFNDTWGLVNVSGTKGYVQLSGLIKVSDATLTPTMNANATVNVSKVTFYKYASSSSKAVGNLAKGASVTVLAYDDIWAYVQCGSNKGYCTLSSLTRISNPTLSENEALEGVITASAPVYTYAITTSGKLATLSSGTAVTVLAHSSAWALIESGSTKGYVNKSNVSLKSDVTLKENEAYVAKVTTAGTVYKYMFNGSPKAGSVSKGMTVNVLGHNTTWALIEKSGNKGYYPMSGLQIQLDEFTSPTIKAMSGTVIRKASVYTVARQDAATVGTLPMGTAITITAYTDKWARVTYNSGTYYMLKSYLSAAEYTTLKSGSTSSNDILKLQKALEDLGYFDGLPAGNYGSLTTNAVTRFQGQIGITETGNADIDTLRVLYGGYAPESTILSQTLKKGNVGSNVNRLQTRLTYKGYLSASIDSDYGALTESAVKLYQKTAGLSETGIADAQTLKSLFNSAAPKNKTSAISGGGTSQGSTGGGTAGTGKYSTDPKDDPAPGTADDAIELVITYALQQLGKPYIYGTAGPNSYDCSGLTTYCYKKIGISLGRSAYAQGYGKGTKIETVGALKRGDIVCMNTLTDSDLSDHVGIYLGGGKMIHASSSAAKVIISTLSSGYYNRVFSWGRRVV